MLGKRVGLSLSSVYTWSGLSVARKELLYHHFMQKPLTFGALYIFEIFLFHLALRYGKNRARTFQVAKALDGYSLKVMGFFEPLKVRAAEAKSDFPTRHDWDEFFRNAPNMNELRPGERPDTVFLSKIPSNWFKVLIFPLLHFTVSLYVVYFLFLRVILLI